jgi:hypothetical protein
MLACSLLLYGLGVTRRFEVRKAVLFVLTKLATRRLRLWTMNALVSKFRSVESSDEYSEDNIKRLSPALWGSQAGFGNLQAGAPPEFALPNIPSVSYDEACSSLYSPYH